MRFQYVLEVNTDGRFDTAQKRGDLMEKIGGRAWTIDGVVPNGAEIKLVGIDVVVISKAEYDQMKHTIDHLKKQEKQ